MTANIKACRGLILNLLNYWFFWPDWKLTQFLGKIKLAVPNCYQDIYDAIYQSFDIKIYWEPLLALHTQNFDHQFQTKVN